MSCCVQAELEEAAAVASASMPGRGRRGAKQTASAGGSPRGHAPGGGFHAGNKEWCALSIYTTCPAALGAAVILTCPRSCRTCARWQLDVQGNA